MALATVPKYRKFETTKHVFLNRNKTTKLVITCQTIECDNSLNGWNKESYNMFASNLLRVFYIIWSMWLLKGCSGLEAPQFKSVTATDEGGIFVTWKPVNSSLDNSVLGYKIIIYEVKEKTARMYKLVNGDQQPGLVVEERTDEVFGTIPLRMAKQMLAEGADTENIVIDYIKPNSLHELRILAYTKDKESKMSEPWRVKLLIDSKMQGVAHRHLNQCVFTIRSKDIATDTPTIYNNYM